MVPRLSAGIRSTAAPPSTETLATETPITRSPFTAAASTTRSFNTADRFRVAIPYGCRNALLGMTLGIQRAAEFPLRGFSPIP